MLNLVTFNFTLTRGAEFHFFHGPAIYALIRDRLGKTDTFPKGLFFLPVESGRVKYHPHAGYNIGIALSLNATVGFAELVDILNRPPRTHYAKTDYAPFGNGLKLDKITDCITGEPISPGDNPETLSVDDLKPSIEKIISGKTLKISFDSPLLILRTPVAKRALCFDDRVFDPGMFLDKVKTAMEEQFADIAPQGAPPPVRLTANRMIRTDVSYPKKRLIGSRGSIDLEFTDGIDETWAQSLLIAGLIGVGKSTRMGQGRFSIEGASAVKYWPPKPVQNLCERAAHPENLAMARESIMSAGKAPGIDHVELDQFIEGLTYRLDQYGEEMASGEVETIQLRGILLKKPDGRMRPLAIPTMKDRFMQRAVMQELTPAVNQLIEDSSFAYRKGLSRANARFSIQLAGEEGYKYVFESDIRTFFDVVDWELLEIRLRAYFGNDPVVDLLMEWVRAPISYAGREIMRDKGLPQGAVISPLLANLYLDAFDEAMEEKGFRLVRYADDFVILCKTQEDVTRAHEAVIDELERLRLSVADDKTSETSFDEGFKFLGYLFCRSVILDSPRKKSVIVPIRDEEDWLESAVMEMSDMHASGWLMNLIKDFKPEIDQSRPIWRKPLPSIDPARRPVYITDPTLKIGGGKRGLLLYEKSKENSKDKYKYKLKTQIQWERILEISIAGGWNFTSGMINQAMRHNIPVTFYTRSGEPRGKLVPRGVRDPSPLAVQQYKWLSDDKTRLAVAQSLIEAKIHNQRLLIRRQPGDNSRLREVLQGYCEDIIRCESVAKLRGIEGQAAHAYFSQWDKWVKPDFSFDIRVSRGAEDPVNVMLNFLYTQLFRACWMALLSEGLDAFAGILHVGKGRYAALAADMQEPFRFLCERLVFDLIRRHRVIKSDFVYQEKYAVKLRIKNNAVKLILEEWEKRLETVVSVGDETKTYRKHIFSQAESIRKAFMDGNTNVSAFRMKW